MTLFVQFMFAVGLFFGLIQLSSGLVSFTCPGALLFKLSSSSQFSIGGLDGEPLVPVEGKWAIPPNLQTSSPNYQ